MVLAGTAVLAASVVVGEPISVFDVSPAQAEEVPCSEGTFSIDGLEPCEDAPPGTYVDAPGATEPTPCAPGTYQELSASVLCIQADPGHFVAEPGSDQQTPCEMGHFAASLGQTECDPAPPGTFVDMTGASEATLCPIAYFSASEGSTECTGAEPGHYVDQVGADQQTACPPGRYAGAPLSTSCTEAPIGSYVPVAGADRATLCPAGTYSDAPGASACTPAPPGSYVGLPGSSFALLCAPGFTTIGSGATACRDASAPVVTPRISGGKQGTSGWFVSGPVVVTFDVDDPQSDEERVGCAGGTVSTSTTGTMFTCSATSPGGTTTVPVTVRLDDRDPELVFTGNAGTYRVRSRVAIRCSARDATSGIASVECPGVKRPGWRLRPGKNAVTGTATDRAGNTTTASTSFVVTPTSRDLCRLTSRFVTRSRTYSSASAETRQEAKATVVTFCRATTSSLKEARPVVRNLTKGGYLRAVEARAVLRHLRRL